MYTITLSDGTKLENLRLNGNNFIADYKVTEDDFRFKLSQVDIESTDDEPSEVELGRHHNMELLAIQTGEPYMEEGEYWFILGQISEEQMKYGQLKADIEYLAMMTDTEL